MVKLFCLRNRQRCKDIMKLTKFYRMTEERKELGSIERQASPNVRHKNVSTLDFIKRSIEDIKRIKESDEFKALKITTSNLPLFEEYFKAHDDLKFKLNEKLSKFF